MIPMSGWRKTISVLMAMLLVAAPVLAQEGMGDYMQGKLDGERDARGSPLWFVAGLGCGIFGAGAAYLIKPNPPASGLIGKSAEYVMGYTEGYKNKGRDRNTMWACAGWLTWVIIYVAIILPDESD